MSKEIKYQNEGQAFIEKQWQAYNGNAIKIYTEEFNQQFDDVLQECSPLIGGNKGQYDYLKTNFNIVGLREKINEFNQDTLTDFLKKNKSKESVVDLLEKIFIDFKNRYEMATDEVEIFQLIFRQNHELDNKLKRGISLKGIKEQFYYNVIHYEQAGKYSGKNAFYTIRERRIPINLHTHKKTERSDFTHYINGIPLILVEYKTEDSGILESLKDFEFKESYRKAPFKIALNDGRDVIFFSDIRALKFKSGKDNSFKWVHYLPQKKYVGEREFNNIEYLFDELLCQPENLYSYCLDCCSVVKSNSTTTSSSSDNSKSNYYLLNGRIQQYYALKDIKKTLVNISQGSLAYPYNYEFAHAQRSGKTITMKFISYMIEKLFRNVFHTIFMYTPDLQIKNVLNQEFSKSGNQLVSLKVIETRAEYREAVESLYNEEQSGNTSTAFKIYIVNMQKITDDDLLVSKVIKTKNILNIIDEAHHGQSSKTAVNRDTIFPNASNYLFTATGKSNMYAYYFPDNKVEGFRNKFTISNAKKCKITVPVMYLKAEKHFQISEKLIEFTKEAEKRLISNRQSDADIFDMDNEDTQIDQYLDLGKFKISNELKRRLATETIEEKIKCIVSFIDSVKTGLPFSPKAIVYVDSIEIAKKYIEIIQSHNPNNDYLGCRWGVDFSSIKDICSQLNPGIVESSNISAKFEKTREKNQEDLLIIDILIAVDKYQKGFDLPTLLATFLDTNISEPSRMNQIYTRSATKYEGKTMGYCVDLTLNNYNEETYKQSLVLYDNPDDIKDCFIDDKLMTQLKQTLTKQFKDLREVLNLKEDSFTSNMILQQILNEADLDIRKQRQYAFFFTTKSIITNLSKIGSPMFFKPFMIEIKVLYEAFDQFKLIYADKSHPEHNKILINTDKSFNNQGYITDAEIKAIVNEVLVFVNENNIRDILSFDYTNKHKEIIAENAPVELIKKINQDIKKNNVQKTVEEIEDYLSKNHRDLLDIIKDMLVKITDDRNSIYEDITQEKLVDIEKQLAVVKTEMAHKIKTEYKGNSFLFWSNEIANKIFEANGLHNKKFISYMSDLVGNTMNIIFPQIDADFSSVNKVKIALDMFKDKVKAESFSFYLRDYKNMSGLDSEFLEQIKNAPKSFEGELFFTRKDLFKQFLNQSLQQHYQNSLD